MKRTDAPTVIAMLATFASMITVAVMMLLRFFG